MAKGQGCAFAHGGDLTKHGTLGNENIIGGKTVCDYCMSLLMDMEKAGGITIAPVEFKP